MKKPTRRQKEVIEKMKDGWIVTVGINYVMLSKGFDDEMINVKMFFNMVENKIIYQETRPPFDYVFHPNFIKT